MYCINDLRCILSLDTHIRVWDSVGDCDYPQYEGSLGALQFTDPTAKATIVSMMVFSGVLVFFIYHE